MPAHEDYLEPMFIEGAFALGVRVLAERLQEQFGIVVDEESTLDIATECLLEMLDDLDLDYRLLDQIRYRGFDGGAEEFEKAVTNRRQKLLADEESAE